MKDSENISINNIKVISTGKYTDGIHVLSSRNINVDSVISLINFNNVTIDGTRLTNNNKSSHYSDIPFYTSNSCVYNQTIN